MRCISGLIAPFAGAIATVFIAASMLTSIGSANATEPGRSFQLTTQRHAARLSTAFETATLRALHFTLSEVGDGSTFVWHHRTGRIRGVFKPTSSYQKTDGKVCRHIVIILSARHRSGKVEGIACRASHGGWVLDG
jgi:hypothetical protein